MHGSRSSEGTASFRTNYVKSWCEEVVEDGFGPCESVVSSSCWHRASREADVEEADGSSSSRNDGVGVVISLHGSEQLGCR